MLGWLRSIAAIPAAIYRLQVDVSALREPYLRIPTQLNRIERLIMTTADNLVARLDAAGNEIAADLSSLRDALAAAVAGTDTAVQEAVTAELAKLDAPIARLEALGADEADPVPAAGEPGGEPAPTPDESAPGEPLS